MNEMEHGLISFKLHRHYLSWWFTKFTVVTGASVNATCLVGSLPLVLLTMGLASAFNWFDEDLCTPSFLTASEDWMIAGDAGSCEVQGFSILNTVRWRNNGKDFAI